MLYKNLSDAILQPKLMCRYRYVQFVTTAFYCMFICMNLYTVAFDNCF